MFSPTKYKMRAAAIFSDRMVLQREKPVTVWGDGENGTVVTVKLAGNSASCAVKDGKWQVTLPPMPAAEGLTMAISSTGEKNEWLIFKEIAIGEVWLCGGQSNMEFEIRNELHGAETLAKLRPDCGVRYYYTPKQRAFGDNFEAVERNTGWAYADKEGSGAWSAVGLYFALELAQKLGVTVGLIGANWGGTSASAWVPRETLEAHKETLPYLEEYARAMEGRTDEQANAEYDEYLSYQDEWWQKYSALMQEKPMTTWEDAQLQIGESRYPGPMCPKNECRPAGIYWTVLRRVCPYTLRGFLFYQGESDDHRPEAYETLLTALIERWRYDWGDAELPFLFVQLPMFRYAEAPDHKHWSKIREAQMNVCRKLRNTGIAVMADSAELDNIHPTDKAPVGHRLALQALSKVYGVMTDEETDAPVYKRGYPAGKAFVVETEHAAGGFRLTAPAEGFQVAGANGKFYAAQAVLMPNRIILTAENVPYPQYARYAWTNYMRVAVFGMNGLPLAPFRTQKDDN